jgi:hypothetical protein
VEDIAATVAFDVWVYNDDHQNGDNILVVPDPAAEGRLRMIPIDFGNSLGGNGRWRWDVARMQAVQDSCDLSAWVRSSVFKNPCDRVSGTDPFAAVCGRIEETSRAVLEAAVANIPTEWGITAEDAKAAVSFLDARKTHVREWLAKNKGSFPQWGEHHE